MALTTNVTARVIVDNLSEMAGTLAYLPEGTSLFCKEDNNKYIIKNGAWVNVTGSGGPGGEAFPIGSVFIAVVNTNPGTLLGYGTWSAFGAGRVLVGRDAGDTDFDVAEETGGSKTVQSSAQTFSGTPFTDVINHTHKLSTILRSATTGGASTIVARTVDATSTGDTTAVTDNPAGGVANITPAGTNAPGAATSVVQPYIVVYMWKRTA